MSAGNARPKRPEGCQPLPGRPAESARRPARWAPLPSTSLAARAAAGGARSGALQRGLGGRGTRGADGREPRGAPRRTRQPPGGARLRAQRSPGPRGARSLLTFRVHSAALRISGCSHRRSRRPAATSTAIPTQSPAIVAPADRRSADLSPRLRGGEGSASAFANHAPGPAAPPPAAQDGRRERPVEPRKPAAPRPGACRDPGGSEAGRARRSSGGSRSAPARGKPGPVYQRPPSYQPGARPLCGTSSPKPRSHPTPHPPRAQCPKFQICAQTIFLFFEGINCNVPGQGSVLNECGKRKRSRSRNQSSSSPTAW